MTAARIPQKTIRRTPSTRMVGTWILLLVCILCAPLSSLAFRPSIKSNKGDQILEKQRTIHAVRSEISELRLASIDAHGEVVAREFISVFSQSDSIVQGLIIFTKPETIRGTILLAHRNLEQTDETPPDAWLYLPALDTIRKVDQNMPGEKQFFGSEFTWDDIMLESMTPYDAKWIRSTHFQNRPVELIELSPKTGPSYLRECRQLYVDSKTFQTLRVDVFARSSDLTKTLTAYDYGSPDVDGVSKRPHRLIAQNISSLNTSVLTLIKARQNLEIPDKVFRKEGLRELSTSTDPFYFLSEVDTRLTP